jgi:Ser/Thr protein kinase RdoA (MazF antagonist)
MTAEAAAALWGGRVLRLISARENAVYEMALPQGRAALRLHRTGYQSEDAIRSELWLTGALASAGVPVARPIPARDGSLLARVDGRHASAIAWADGAPMGAAGVPLEGGAALALERHAALGRLLARMHRVTAALDLPPWFARPRWDCDGLVGEAPFWGRFWEHPALAPDEAEILRAARAALRDRLSRLSDAIQPIHADVLRENVLCDGDRLVLIDFDDMGWGFRGFDLGTVMSQNLYEPARDDLRAALIDGYGGGMTVEEVAWFTLARVCASVGWAAPRLAEGDPIHRSHIARAVMWARIMTG